MLKERFNQWFKKFTDLNIKPDAEDRAGAAWHLFLHIIISAIIGLGSAAFLVYQSFKN